MMNMVVIDVKVVCTLRCGSFLRKNAIMLCLAQYPLYHMGTTGVMLRREGEIFGDFFNEILLQLVVGSSNGCSKALATDA